MSQLIRNFESFQRIADGGVVVNATLELYREGDSRLLVRLIASAENWLILIGVPVSVTATLVNESGGTYSQIRVDLEQVPPRSPIGGPPGRRGVRDLVLAVTGPDVARIASVRFEAFDRNNPGLSMSQLIDVGSMVLPLLL